MEVVICKTKEEASKLAADMITAQVKKNPKTVLGLATGSTPVLMYNEMAKAVKAKRYAYAAKKLGPFRGTCAAVDDKWGELVALADSETEKITSNAALKPKLRKLKLQGIVSKFGPVLGEKAKKALAEQAE